MTADNHKLDERQRVPTAQERVAMAIAKGMAIAEWAKLMPHAPAVVSVHGGRSFAELNGRANQLARMLRARGLETGDSVALMSSNRAELAEVVWATRRTGYRITLINWHLTGEEAGYIVNDCDAKAFFADARFAAAAAQVTTQLPCARFAFGGSIEGFDDYETSIRTYDSSDIADPQIGGAMLYTSGTTGNPKGVYRPSGAPPPTAASVAASYSPGVSVHLCTGPLYHAAPLSFSLVIPHMYGATIVMMDGWDAERALQLIEQHRVTHTHMVPTMFHRLLSLPESVRRKYDVSSLKHVIHGAAPCPVPIKRAMIEWLGPVIHEYYAATEGLGTLVDSDMWLRKPGTVGKADDIDQIKIMDEAGQELPRHQAGLVYQRAPEQGRFSYYKDEQKTRKAYRGDYYTLGDIGYLDDDGYLFLTDRSAHLIISGGVNIYPAEVEAVLLTHPAVADVGVIGVPNAEWGEEVKAVVMLQPGQSSAPELEAELIQYCRARLAHFKCPRSVDFVSELPRHDNGKLYKQKLREQYRTGKDAQRQSQ